MSTEVTPESLRVHAEYADKRGGAVTVTAIALRRMADQREREQRPLPTEPGWYPTIVVERGGESCTGALLRADEWWLTARTVAGIYAHALGESGLVIRWAEQDGKTPGQTLYEAWWDTPECLPWSETSPESQAEQERIANAVLAAHGTPTLTPVGEHPEPGTRGLLPVVFVGDGWGGIDGAYFCDVDGPSSSTVLADPRPGGAHE